MSAKIERVELRLTPELKNFDRQTRTELTVRDFRRFIDIVDRDEEPNAALRNAFKRHKARRG